MWKKRTCNFDQTVVTRKTSKKANHDLCLYGEDLSKASSESDIHESPLLVSEEDTSFYKWKNAISKHERTSSEELNEKKNNRETTRRYKDRQRRTLEGSVRIRHPRISVGSAARTE
jgi:hypothetical protein